ncbi:MAG TPA: acyl-CoA desaturase [Longimicrobiales bacterium]|nr:acyl-CoA desaturase [Longimicrobiales bacterium]
MAQAKIRFPKKDAALFIPEVKDRVAAYFEETGLSTKADRSMVLKTVIMLGTTFGAYGLIMSGRFSPWTMLGLAVVMGVGMAGIGFAVAHDALHGAYSANPRINRVLGFTFDLLGANGYMWKITHNVIHHTYTNIHGVDEDLTVSPLLRLSPGAPRYGFHRYQHFYGLAAYSLATLNWVFAKDYQQFLKKDIGPYRDRRHPPSEIATLIIMKLVCYGYMIVLPLLLLDITWWQFLIGFLAAHLTAGTILGVIFQLAHVVEGPEYPLPDDGGQMEQAWLLHEMATTSNFAPRNRLLSWYVGGLNYQIEHHLFPQVCSVHYPALAPIVREVAERHGVPYHSQPTLRAAVASHLRMLKRLGQPDAAPRALAT